MSPILVAIAAFIGVAALVGGVAMWLRGSSSDQMAERLDTLTSKKKPGDDNLLKHGSLAEQFKGETGFFEQLAERFSRFGMLFEQADTNLTPTRFVLVSVLAAGGCVTVSAIARLHMGLWPLMAILGGVMPMFWLSFRRKRRLKKFAAQLSDALELIARALRAGHSLAAGFQLVSQEMSDPLAKEFNRVFEEQNLGVPLEEALEGLSDRIPNLDLRFFCTAIILQRTTGGDLAEILDKIGKLIRERFQIWGQVQALTGEGRLSGIVLLALPPLLFLAVWRLNPDYVGVLFTDPMGKQMLLGALVMQVLGALVIRKIVNIKV